MDEQLLYRLRDAQGELLYIGITGNLGARLQQHEAAKPWFGDVRTVEIERHPTRSEVAEAERQAVRGEDPLYNLVRFRGSTNLRSFRVNTELWQAAKAAAEQRGESLTSVVVAGLQEYIDTEES